MITLKDYFGPHKGFQTAHVKQATVLLQRVNKLLDAYGVELINPATRTRVSGETFGGWRPASCPIGAPASAHKTGEAVDVYDPDGALDTWLTDELLTEFDLYREHPDHTAGWCHLSTRAPKSGKRTFLP